MVFEVGGPNGKLTSEAALAMAEINGRWGHRGPISVLEKQHAEIIDGIPQTSSTPIELEVESQVEGMILHSEIILGLEELAASFRESRDDSEDLGPSFMEDDDPRGMLIDYAKALGCTVELL